jgi:hypothetical protein
MPDATSGPDSGMTQMGGDGGSQNGADGAAAAVAPIMRNNRWAWDVGDLTFEVDPNFGGRVTTLSLGGINMLTGPSVNAIYFGSTFWTSPESQWAQPPPVQIDSAPYTATMSNGSLTLTGPTVSMGVPANSKVLGVAITKTFSVDSQGVIHLTYMITNHNQAAVQMAPWEVTRVPAGGMLGGLTFYPTGTKMTLSAGATFPFTTAPSTPGITWFSYDQAKVTNNSKLYADGLEGWYAHVDQGMVFIKQFPPVAPAQQAPGEGDVELFVNAPPSPANRYVEMEIQGAYQTIAPGASLSWSVTWYLKHLPATVTPAVGDATLVQFVRSTIQH